MMTPGPWKIDPETRHLGGGDMAIAVVSDDGATEVALLQFHTSDNEAQDCAAADARLVAAAPEIRDALAAYLAAGTKEARRLASVKAKAALAKARP